MSGPAKHIPVWLISGVLYGLAWPAFSLETGWLAWVALVPVLLRLRRVRSFREHAAQTLPVFLVALPFVCWWLSYFSVWAMPMIWLTQGPFLWVPMALLYPLQRRFGWQRALWSLPLLWTVWEWAWLYLCDFNLAVGGPMTTQCNLLLVNQFADITGGWGLVFWAIGFNVLLATTIDRSATWSWGMLAGRLALVSAAWLAGPVLYGLVVRGVPSLVVKSSLPPVQVGLVQTNEDSYAARTDSSAVQVVQRLVALGTKAAEAKPNAARPDLIVAPEGAFPLPLLRDSVLFAGMRQYVQYYDTPFATGLMTPLDSSHYYNEAFVFTPELSRIYEPMQVRPEDLRVYRKQHSLAFGETSPRLLRWADRWLRPGEASVKLGDAPYTFTFTDRQQNTRTVAIGICWEQLYPATIAGLARGTEGSPEFLALIMNDGWFYDSPGPRILLAISQLRTIETRRSIARCSNQGYSGYVDPFGRVVGALPRRQQAVGQFAVVANTKLTFFTQHPNWFPILCGLVLLLGLLLRLRRQPLAPHPSQLQPQNSMKKQLYTLVLVCLSASATLAQTTVIINSPTQSGSAVGQFNTVVGSGNAGASLAVPSLNNTFVGYDAGSGVVSGTANTFVGTSAGQSTTSGSQNTFVGTASGYNSLTTTSNTFVGNQSGFSTLSSGNTFIGSCAGRANTLGLNNVFVGACTGGGNQTGSNNTIVGNGAGPANFNSNDNVYFGFNAGRSDQGRGNTFLGTDTDVLAGSAPLFNASAIGYGARVSVSNALVLGNEANVGVGTSAPTARLHVVGNVPGESGLRLETLTNQSQPVVSTDKFLTVNGKGEVVLGRPRLQIDNPNQWADRVFATGYRLRSLPETERFIQKNGHLPDVPSAETVAREGVDLVQMNALLLQKVEELTLHVIRLEKQLKRRK